MLHLVSSEQPESLSRNSESVALQTALQGVMGGEDVAARQTPCAKRHRPGPRTCVRKLESSALDPESDYHNLSRRKSI